MRREGLDQRLVHFWRTGHDVCPKLIHGAVQCPHATAGFLNQQRARGRVPGLQTQLPEAVDATGGDVGQIKCR